MTPTTFSLPVLGLALLALTACERNLITAENAARLKPGMPVEQVKQILGERNVGIATGAISQSFAYRTDQLFVQVETRRGKIVQVLTRDAARPVPVPTRNAMPLLEITIDKFRPQADAAFAQGGRKGLTEWVQRELVPGRPVKTSTGKEVLLADRLLCPLDADGFPDYARAVVPPLTDEHIWYKSYSSVISCNWNDQEPPLTLIVLVTR